MPFTRARTATLVFAITAAALLVMSLAPSMAASADGTISGRPAAGGGLLVSQSPDRGSPMDLDGATVAADEMYVFYAVGADPLEDEGTRWVDFHLDGERVKREWISPFDLAGTSEDGRAMALDVGGLEPGPHTIEARVRGWGKPTPAVTATFVVDRGQAAESGAEASGLKVSARPDRGGAWDLDGSVLSGAAAYVFWTNGAGPGDDTGIAHVEFALDGEHQRRESLAPYDLAGTGDGVALPLSIGDLGPGEHTVTATVTATDGTSSADTASFAVPAPETEAPDSGGTDPVGTGSGGTDSGGTDSGGTDSGGSGTPAGAALSWAPPTLENPTTIEVSTAPNTIFLEDGKDYRIVMPSRPVTKAMAIRGGRNVVLVGGEISIPWQGSDPSISQRRGLLIRDQTGVVHVEGLLIHGDDLSEGIQIDAEDAVVQLQNVRVMNLHARDQVEFSDNHPDVVQPYGGVEELRIDRLTGETDYQGLFLAEDLGPIGRVDLRRVNILGTDTARYLLWAGDYPLQLRDVWADPAPGRSWDMTVWDDDRWGDAQQGVPAGGDFVEAGTVGIGYVSPGYSG